MEKILSENLERLPYKCVLNIQAIYHSLKTAEKKAVDFIITHPQEIKDTTIDDLAIKAGCSKATVVRVSRRLGYKGFHELRNDFSIKKQANYLLEYEGISKTDEPFIVMQKVFESSIRSIKDTLGMIERSEFLKALDALINAQKILFCGIGDASLVAMEAYQRFTRLGINCSADMDPDIQLLKSSQLDRSDVFFAISYSGRSKPVIKCAKIANDAGATTIALTNYPLSPLAKRSDILLQTAVFTRYSTGEVISKRLTELLVIESLYTSYIINKIEEIKNRIKRSYDILKINKA